MATDDWRRPEDVAALLGVKTSSVVRRARRLEEGGGGEGLVRRVSDAVEGGKPRVEIHADLVARWMSGSSREGVKAPTDEPFRAWKEVERARNEEAVAIASRHAAELAKRDEEISRLSATLMSKELELARVRRQLADLGSAVASLTADS